MIHRPAGERPKITLSQLEEDVIYFLCPDKTCDLFFDDSYNYVPCDRDCPKKEDLVKIIICKVCKDMVVLPESFTSWQRLDHPCKREGYQGGVGASFFSGTTYGILYELPRKD